MASYRLIDEIPGAHKGRPPFSPAALFLVNCLFLPFAAPFWVINWARLGQPEKRLLTGALALAAFALEMGMLFKLDPQTAGNYLFLPGFAYGYWQLNSQRPLYRAHLLRGGAKAPTWPVWIAVGLGLALQIMVWLLSGR